VKFSFNDNKAADKHFTTVFVSAGQSEQSATQPITIASPVIAVVCIAFILVVAAFIWWRHHKNKKFTM